MVKEKNQHGLNPEKLLQASFDAMISKRPYNTIKSTEEAIKEIEDKAGSYYDPELVPVFIEILKEQKIIS